MIKALSVIQSSNYPIIESSMTSDLPKQPILEHLVELKRRLILCTLVFIVTTLICYQFAGDIYAFLVRPLAEAFPNPEHRRLIYTGLTEAFMAYLKLALFAGFFLSLSGDRRAAVFIPRARPL